ncbi:tRNA(Ile)-lysidine synthase [Salegentibacter holothuriorum]|uniref:tRNA(Ile)-lysidine synthase n=1 Tax=Salegentibacter holothuriorum TaxID=241145 RepID=A0A1T5AUT8_9FLAO|nr:tRNA lysidine(34) synthetase TilS [Salegentibacter holothuriorum]SKB38742.1 tRNA(Ile)-lysidine synthase [Salegentibacter holothuriorum]
MEKAFKNEIKSQYPYLCNSKILIAVSGGLDSVVLTHLCNTAKLDFSLAHCNFNLRDEESDADEDFVAALAKNLKVALFIENFDTEKYAKDNGLSTQMAARELRYNWFETLRIKHQFDFTLTAHHANDSLETFFINLIRGTGLEGLSGINADSNYIIRPLLNFSRKEILAYAEENNIPWQEDSTNASTKYLRNKIRHEIVPVFEEINPQFLETFLKTQSHLKENEELIEDYLSLLYPKIIGKTAYGYSLDINYLKKVPNTSAILYQLLKSFGFTEWNDVYHLLDAQPGKMVFSTSHRLVKDRDYLLLTEIDETEDKVYEIAKNEDFAMLPMGTFSFLAVDDIHEKTSNCIYVDPGKLEFPLKVRKWQKGDIFYPFGMKGKKKLSDFFKDKKLSLPDKENSWLLCSGEKIVWVINQRADRRFSITLPNQKIIKITFSL